MDDVATVLTLGARKATKDDVFFFWLITDLAVFPVKIVVSIAVVVSDDLSLALVVETWELRFGLTEAISLEFVNKRSVDIFVVSVVLDLFTLSSSSFDAAVIVVLDSAAVSFVASSRPSVCETVNNC